MDRKGNEQVNALLSAVIASNPKLAEGYCKHKIKSQWRDISGEYVANATEEISFEGRKMFVKVKSSIIRSEMLQIRRQLVCRINQTAGANIIDELIVR